MALCIEGRLVATPVRAVNSAISSRTVASAFWATSRLSSLATLPRMGESLPPHEGRTTKALVTVLRRCQERREG
ncbi:hypothetical protein ACIHQR_12935 [Corallococcus coralloides]|uniref:hypothetical protein n=1 Tax=Corallococcus coralloides TaxID=184914 RepID=UPI00384C3671